LHRIFTNHPVCSSIQVCIRIVYTRPIHTRIYIYIQYERVHYYRMVFEKIHKNLSLGGDETNVRGAAVVRDDTTKLAKNAGIRSGCFVVTRDLNFRVHDDNNNNVADGSSSYRVLT